MSKSADDRVERVMKRAEDALNHKDALIQRQKAIIDRLAIANAVYADLVYTMLNEGDGATRALAQQAQDKVKGILAVPNQEEGKSGE